MKPDRLKGIFSQRELVPFTKQRNFINVIYLVILYSISSLLIALYPHYGNPVYVILGIVIMGGVHHTLATFVHEAAHLNLFTNRKFNDFFGHALCSAPLVSFLKDYRYFHFEHHRHTGKFDKDPELKFYRAMGIKPSYSSRSEVLKVFMHDVTGVSYIRSLNYLLKFFKEKRNEGLIDKPSAIEILLVLLWLTVVPFAAYKLNLLVPYLLFWVLPLLTISPTFLRWHGFGEHIREKNGPMYENTLTHRMSIIPTLLLYPINSSFHLEHHLYPQIPWYELKNFYHWARKNPVYREESDRLTVDGFFMGKETVLKVAFPIEK